MFTIVILKIIYIERVIFSLSSVTPNTYEKMSSTGV